MCWHCDNPDKTRADYLDLIVGTIAEHGVFLQHVEKDRWRPPFTYTVGLTMLGHPELLVTGMHQRRAGPCLNRIAHGLRFHAAPDYVAGDLHAWPEHPEIPAQMEVVDVAVPTAHLLMAEEIFGPHIRAVQLVYVDDRGRWPWQVGFRGDQPVLGPRADVRAG
ncbi:DUF4262 domain-containing protein [Nocardioides sp. zg-536]|uniref:DUF4262 domain-containing protein n=1 Tax=Nocardioides faecalis TaxID=2803858 RepID=A0A939BXB7_9ACTN|nr:DUF4262 domain-containing protein [Nocardioides faecalis]MBM9458650.1 DUF4262 domain-containing protein [Nocardioides faecalis]QVI58645.1 DUF4262 domain-containing protein [Nocardioides faecalis]